MTSQQLRQLDESTLQSVTDEYERDGATVIRDVVPDAWLEQLAIGTERIMENPQGAGADFNRAGEGRFFGDLFAYLRTPEYRDFIQNSGVGRLAAEIMHSDKVRFFYDQPLVKEPGTPKRTPWHQDASYWPCTGQQIMSVWVPLDPATPDNGVVTYIKGSHQWSAYYPMEQWGEGPEAEAQGYSDFTADSPAENPGPGATKAQPRTLTDIRKHPDNYEMLSWNVQPGDVLIHHMNTIHGAPGNATQDQRRRAVAFRFFGDDARWDDSRPHFIRMLRQQPDFPYPDHQTGDLITDPLFPIVWPELAPK